VVDSKGGVGVVFGEYSCYDEKTKQLKEEKLLVELPPSSSTGQTSLMMDTWGPCSTSTLDLLKTKPGDPIEMVTYSALPTLMESTSAMSSKRGSFVDTTMQFNSPQQFDYAVQSSDQMSFKAIEEAVKAAAGNDSEITRDDDIPEPPPPPRSFLAAAATAAAATTTTAAAAANGNPAAVRRGRKFHDRIGEQQRQETCTYSGNLSLAIITRLVTNCDPSLMFLSSYFCGRTCRNLTSTSQSKFRFPCNLIS